MDSASKAVIMAGAVLIAIGIVAIGVFLFRNAATLSEGQVKDISYREIQAINSIFTKYSDECSGVDIVSLLRDLQTYNKNHSDAQIPLTYSGITMYDASQSNTSKFSSLGSYNVKFSYNELGLINAITVE